MASVFSIYYIWDFHNFIFIFIFENLIHKRCLFSGKNLLNDFIQHYEGLSYDVYSVERSHQRARRSLDNDVVRLRFQAHGRFVFNNILRFCQCTKF